MKSKFKKWYWTSWLKNMLLNFLGNCSLRTAVFTSFLIIWKLYSNRYFWHHFLNLFLFLPKQQLSNIFFNKNICYNMYHNVSNFYLRIALNGFFYFMIKGLDLSEMLSNLFWCHLCFHCQIIFRARQPIFYFNFPPPYIYHYFITKTLE